MFLISYLSCFPIDVCWGQAPIWGLCAEWLRLQQAESAETDLPGSTGLQDGLLPAGQLQIQVRLDKPSQEGQWVGEQVVPEGEMGRSQSVKWGTASLQSPEQTEGFAGGQGQREEQAGRGLQGHTVCLFEP